ncbi:unnamed protein product [Hymenolepis diminuta]|uniref:Uncharacterized protein n=3 Tax=Hymenolepis diminuta TaxID=6216 RepID=A0A564Z516_HYMDI|nr:unnamed protein product [Hymenolepis diminuta]
MSFLKNDSIFDVTGISLTDFTLSYDSELVPLSKSQGKVEEDKDFSSKEIDSPVQKSETTESGKVGLAKLNSEGSVPVKQSQDVPSKPEVKGCSEGSQLGLAKLAIRHDIMDQISTILSDLVAIDMKYSKLAEITNTKVEPRPQAASRNLVPQIDKTPLDTLHNFTISELHKQLGSVRNYIQDLDLKYSDVARGVEEKILNLEQANINLIAEVERLRKFY